MFIIFQKKHQLKMYYILSLKLFKINNKSSMVANMNFIS